MKFIKSKVPFLITVALFALFNIIFLTVVFTAIEASEQVASFWISYAFIDVAFILVALFSFFFRLKSKNTMTTVVPFLVSIGGYLLLTLIVNAIMMAFKAAVYWPIIVNAILIIICAVVVLICYKSFSRVADNTEKMQKRVTELRATAVKANSLTFLAKDDEVKAALRKFKQNIDYSSPAGTPATAEYEAQLDEAIQTIQSLLEANAEKESVLEAIQAAENTLKMRNQMLMASRNN